MSLHPINEIVEAVRNGALNPESALVRSLHMASVIGSLPFEPGFKPGQIVSSTEFLATNPIVFHKTDHLMHDMSIRAA